MSKHRFNSEYLPKEIGNIIKKITSSEREFRTYNNYLTIIGSIYNHQISDDASYLQYSPLSSKYWKRIIGSHYSQYINRLLQEEVIQRNLVDYISDFGEVSRVIGYRINPKLLGGVFTLVRYRGIKSDSESSDATNSREMGDNALTNLEFNPDSITMLKKQALGWIGNSISMVFDSYINNEYINGVPKTLPVLVRTYNNDDCFKAFYMSVEAAQEYANSQGKKLLYYKDKFIIADEEYFKGIAIKNLTSSYKWYVNSFKSDTFNFSRNKNTLRVNSKLTSLPTALLPFLRINGYYILQADLKCSQFTLFANLINYYLNHSGKELIALFKKKKVKSFVSSLVSIFDKHKFELPEEGLNTTNPVLNDYITNDIYKFLVDTLLQDFYSVIRSELNLPLRVHGKSIAFRTVFSKPKPENELVRQFREIYPSVIMIINEYKVKHGYNNFAIGLQCLEAEIFIDNIWKKVKKANINCFTRHDSIVFPITRKPEVDLIINEVFDSFDFMSRVIYEEFNTEEIRDRSDEDTDDNYFIFGIDDLSSDAETMEELIDRLSDDFIDQLLNIALPQFKEDDYNDSVSMDILEELYELDGLSSDIKLTLDIDMANIQHKYSSPHFQDDTNNFISVLIDIKSSFE